MDMNRGRLISETMSPLGRVSLSITASFVAISLLLLTEFTFREQTFVQLRLAIALLGFASCWSIVLGLVVAIGGFLSQALGVPQGKWRSFSSCLLISLPAWPVCWWLSQRLFRGGWAKSHDLEGQAPYLVFLALIFASVLLLRCWQFTWRSRPGWKAVLLLGIGGLTFFLDASFYLGLYRYLHQILAIVTFFCLSLLVTSVLRPLVRNRLAKRCFVVGLIMAFFLSFFHLSFLFRGLAPERLLIFEKLTLSKSLSRLLPYERVSEELEAPISLSPRSVKWRNEREEARKSFRDWRGTSKLNLLVVSIDAVRRDHTTLHGYGRRTTPFLAEMAKSSFVFEDARSPSTSSFFSLMSLLSGCYPSSISRRRGQDPDLLGRALKSIGVASTGVYTDSVFTARPNDWPTPDLRLGQDHFVFSEEKSEVMVGQVLDVLKRSKKPTFVLTHLMDPHFPYDRHPEFDFGMEEIDAYDSEIAHVDSQLGVLVDGLRDLDLLDSTVVVVTSDHGEAFGEHGAFLHGGVPFEEQCRVPLLIRLPQFKEGRRIKGSVSLASLAPTLVDIMGCRKLANSEAPSLLPLMLGQSDPSDYYAVVERPSYLDRQSFPSVSALVRGPHKIRHHLDSDLHLVFDLNEDPLERNDLSASRPLLARAMGKLYREWRQDCIFREGSSSQMSPEFAALRADILLDRQQRIPELASFLRQGSQEQRDLAAEMMFDLEMRGKIEHPDGLGVEAEDGLAPRVLGLRDLLNAKEERRPFYEAIELCGHSHGKDRQRVAQVLWHLATLPFAKELIMERLEVEEDEAVRGDLLAARAKFDDGIDPKILLNAAKHLSGDVSVRLIISLMSLDSKAVDNLIEETLRGPDTPITHAMIEHLGAVDSTYRRDVIRKLLRLDRYTIRTTAVHALRNFPKSSWLIDMLCQVVRHEVGRSIRIDAAKQLASHGGPKAAKALLDALVAYPKSSLALGYLLADRFPNELWNWDEKQLEIREKTSVGKRHELILPKDYENDGVNRRLLVTLVRQVKPRNRDDHIVVEDATGKRLLDRLCRGRTFLISCDLLPKKTPVTWPLSVMVTSDSRKEGEDVGLVLASLFNLKTKFDLWPSQAENLSMPLVLQRMTGDWRTNLEQSDCCFLPEGTGSLVLVGNGVDHDTIEIEITPPGVPCLLELKLWGHVLGTLELKAGRRREKIVLSGLSGKYNSMGMNRFTFKLSLDRSSLLSEESSECLMALWSLKLR